MPLYIRRLPGTRSRLIDAKTVTNGLVCFNPSKSGKYTYIRATERTENGEVNHILIYDDATKHLHNIPFDASLLMPCVNLFRGLEDLRICEYEGRLWFTATTTHATEHMTNEMLLGRFDESMTRVEFLQVLELGCRPIKNVCPFVDKNNKLCLLDLFKARIYECERVTGETEQCQTTCIQTLAWHAGQPEFYRGSTSPVHISGNTWGCIAHDIIFNDQLPLVTRLSYLHHWVEFDIVRGAVTFVSSPFWIGHWGVEYVSGIDKKDESITLYLGIMDQDTLMCTTTLSDLRCGK